MEGKVAIGEAGGGEFQNCRVRLSGVEVTHEDDLGFRMFFDPLEHEVRGFDPRFLTAVIPVGIEEDKFYVRGFTLHFCPSADAGAGISPGDRSGDFGRIGQPEGAAFKYLEFFFMVENRREFAGVLPIITTDSEPSVVGEKFLEVVDLITEGFLKTDEVGIHFLDRLGDELFAARPSAISLIGSAHADVKGG